ncbi:organic cation transporter protein [Plakobranchus ocellatus]|uniref:Organic cation transporter protein n=1 Tax=Plakobranchus ocellatus TaxID=259542 RepID=A0AAV3XX31_9GAST|nr:organic cation transporter protein [Plakobranchus ocellatus]
MDNVLEQLGWMGCYQKVQFILLMLPVVDTAMHMMSFIFIGRNFEHKCAVVDIPYSTTNDINSTLSVMYGQCSVTVTNLSETIFSSSCKNGYEYSMPQDRSFLTEWDLVCEKDALSEVTQTVMAVGMMLGSSLFMAMADKYGRKPVFVGSHICLFGTAVALAFAPGYVVFLGLRFFLGAFQQGVGLISCLMLIELIPTEKRALPTQVGCIFWPFSLLLLGFVCYLCRDLSWRHTELVLAAISVYSLVQWWIIEESLRWLDVNGKTERAERIIRMAAERNGVDSERVLKLYRDDARPLLLKPMTKVETDGMNVNGHIDEATLNGSKPPPPQAQDSGTTGDGPDKLVESTAPVPNSELSFSTFLKNRDIFTLIAINCYIWFADSVAYYGLIMTSSTLSDNLYLGYTLNILAELPAGLALLTLINRIGRRYSVMVAHLIGGFSLILATALPNIEAAAAIPGLSSIIMFISLLGKFGITLGFGVLFLYTPELFPTTIRSTAFGISSLAARVGGMIAPFSRTLGRHVPWLPGMIFGVLCLIVPILARYLPETHGYELPQTTLDLKLDRSASTKARPIITNGERKRDR